MTQTEFERIVLRIRPRMMKIALDFFQNQEDAEDAVQEVLLRMWLRDGLPNDNYEALAVRATKNVCVSMWRKQKLRRMETIDADNDTSMDSGSSDSQVLTQEQAQRIEQAISRLPRSEQRLIRLKQEADLEADEIAVITGIPVRSVRSMISSARHKLLKLLK
jgi:RNA polymerase sigma-70 factor (ECF subfamily)